MMKKTLRFTGLLCLLSLFSIGALKSQTQINPKVGVESWTIKDEMSQSGTSSHSGQTIGFDVFVMHNRLVFVPGFYYHRMSILNQEEGFNLNFDKRNGTHYFSIPITLGLQVIDLPIIDAFIMAGGESTFFYGLDANDLSLDDDKLHGVFAGLTGGAQVELFSLLTFDIKYHHAFHPIIKERPESKLRGWTFAAGIKF